MTEQPPTGSRAIYLDNAATSFPKPDCVYEAVTICLRENGAAVGRGSHTASEAATRMVEQCRARIATVLDAEHVSRVAFTFNCTDSLNLLLRGILRSGDRVVTTTLEHNSVLRPLQALQTEMDIDVAMVDFDSITGLVDPDHVAAKLKVSPTRLVVLNHASNVTGVVQHVREIAAAAHEHGALLLLDAAQTVGHLPFSVRDLQVDLLAAAGHKGLLGPLGTGILYVKEGLEQQLRSMRSGGTGTASESIAQPEVMPVKFESGNMNAPGLAGLDAAARWLLTQGIDRLHDQAVAQTQQIVSALHDFPGIRLCGGSPSTTNVGIVSFTVDGLDSREVAAILEQSFNIQCRAGLHCAPLAHRQLKTEPHGGTVRLSVGPFTTEEHLQAGIAAVTEIARSLAIPN
ncbi:MAG: aminotransferase class V-fold PLP-dependent enzyme [Fuerstiella sp.]